MRLRGLYINTPIIKLKLRGLWIITPLPPSPSSPTPYHQVHRRQLGDKRGLGVFRSSPHQQIPRRQRGDQCGLGVFRSSPHYQVHCRQGGDQCGLGVFTSPSALWNNAVIGRSSSNQSNQCFIYVCSQQGDIRLEVSRLCCSRSFWKEE